MTISTLFAVLRLLTGGAAAMSSGDVLLLFGLGLHLAVVLGLVAATTEADAVFKDMLKVVLHNYSLFTIHYSLFNGGKV